MRPQMLYRRLMWGVSPLELLVERPVAGTARAQRSAWSWWDELESWTWPTPGQPMTVRAYTTGDRVDLLLNGLPVGTAPLTEGDERIATFTVPYVPGTLVAVAYAGGKELSRKQLVTAGPAAALRLRSDVPSVTTSRDALSHVLVEVVDAAGRLVPDAVVKVVLDVKGGALAAVANGNPHNVDSFQRPRRWTYRGGALAVLRPPTTAGTIVVRASAEGLADAVLSIPVTTEPTASTTASTTPVLQTAATPGMAVWRSARAWRRSSDGATRSQTSADRTGAEPPWPPAPGALRGAGCRAKWPSGAPLRSDVVGALSPPSSRRPSPAPAGGPVDALAAAEPAAWRASAASRPAASAARTTYRSRGGRHTTGTRHPASRRCSVPTRVA